MAELIDRQEIIKIISAAQDSLKSDNDLIWNLNKQYYNGLAWAHRLVLDMPAVGNDSAFRGGWVPKLCGEYKGLYCCSECGKPHPYYNDFDGNLTYWPAHNFCPNCGADMRRGAVEGAGPYKEVEE